MPSLPHEALLQLFRNRPELAPDLLREALGVELPAYSEVRIESADLTEIRVTDRSVRAVPAESRADLVVLLVDGTPVFAIVVEVQLSRKERKRFTWPSLHRVAFPLLRRRHEPEVARCLEAAGSRRRPMRIQRT